MTPRPYQLECLTAITEHLNRGIRRQLVVLPTGVGKAAIAAMLPRQLRLGSRERMLMIVHRDELASQAADKLYRLNPGRSIGIEKADQRADNADIVIGSVQTLGPKGRNGSPFCERIQKFDPGQFRLIMPDEAHHCPSETWQRVLKWFRVHKRECPASDIPLIGFTATPSGRSDNVGLSDFFDVIPYQRNILEMIKAGWLADIEAWRIETDVNLSDVTIRGGDFAVGELEAKINTPKRNALIVKNYMELGGNLPGLAFSADIQHSHDLADMFTAIGVHAVAVSGKTKDSNRRRYIEEYRAGKIDVLVSCLVYTEGSDLPIATVGLMTRPTKSPLLNTQMVGRLFRPYPAPEDAARHTGYRKQRAIILDFADNCSRHDLMSLPTLFGLKPKFNMKGKAVTEVLDEVEQLELKCRAAGIRQCGSIEEMKATVERVELFRAPVIPAVARKFSKYVWIEEGPEVYRLSLPSEEAVVRIYTDHLAQRQVVVAKKGTRTVLGTFRSAEEAFEVADGLVPKEDEILLRAHAGWHKEAPTLPQCGKLYWVSADMRRRFRSKQALYDFALTQYRAGSLSWSKGSISRMIDSHEVAR